MSDFFCDFMDYNLSGSSVHVISQARILEWVAIFFSKNIIRGNINILVIIFLEI